MLWLYYLFKKSVNSKYNVQRNCNARTCTNIWSILVVSVPRFFIRMTLINDIPFYLSLPHFRSHFLSSFSNNLNLSAHWWHCTNEKRQMVLCWKVANSRQFSFWCCCCCLWRRDRGFMTLGSLLIDRWPDDQRPRALTTVPDDDDDDAVLEEEVSEKEREKWAVEMSNRIVKRSLKNSKETASIGDVFWIERGRKKRDTLALSCQLGFCWQQIDCD